MSNTKAVWLCNYNNFDVTETYGIKATLPEIFDAVQFYKLEKKKKSNVKLHSVQCTYIRQNVWIL